MDASLTYVTVLRACAQGLDVAAVVYRYRGKRRHALSLGPGDGYELVLWERNGLI
jgi:hypothetical protein